MDPARLSSPFPTDGARSKQCRAAFWRCGSSLQTVDCLTPQEVGVVTGRASGIGRSIARQFARDSPSVHLTIASYLAIYRQEWAARGVK